MAFVLCTLSSLRSSVVRRIMITDTSLHFHFVNIVECFCFNEFKLTSFVRNSSLEQELLVTFKNFIIKNITKIQFILSRSLIQVLKNSVVIMKQ